MMDSHIFSLTHSLTHQSPLFNFFSITHTVEDIFRDQGYIREIAVGLQRQQIFRPTVEAVRALYEPGSALQQAMNTAPPLYAAVLFTVFRERFQVKPPPATTTTVELRGKVVVVVVVVASIINDRSVLLTILITL